MNFTTRLNKILKPCGIIVEATWCNVVKSYTVWCEYHNGFEMKSVCLEGLCRWTVSRSEKTQDDLANSTALVIIDRILSFESR